MGINQIDQLVEDFGEKYETALDKAKKEAAEKGCGIMTIGADEIIVCEYVPEGRVLNAKDKAAYLRFLEKHRPQDS
jgi:hypothetical protein